MKLLTESITGGHFIKLTLSKSGNKQQSLKNVYARLIQLKSERVFSFTLRYPTKDETHNYSIEEGIVNIGLWLGNDFLNADLFTNQQDVSLQFNKKRKARIYHKKASHTAAPTLSHDRSKNRLIAPNAPYLHALEISSKEGHLRKDGQRKFRQINKYIEIIASLLRQQPLSPKAHIVDMGSGKGYLTFALYDYLNHHFDADISLTGIELRPNLVDFCNTLANELNYDQLDFQAKDIFEYQAPRIDMLIALHACDIATDIAIAKGIQANASIIVVAPCCHKQIRKAMTQGGIMQPILKHGILQERQAELLTDGLRALIMEAHGYKTSVFEFISTEHTPKNLMIVGLKKKARPEAIAEIQRIKDMYGIEEHYLETLLHSPA